MFSHNLPADVAEFYTIDRLTNAYSLSRSTLYEILRSGALKAIKLGTRTLIRRSDIEAWLDAQPSYLESLKAARQPRRNVRSGATA